MPSQDTPGFPAAAAAVDIESIVIYTGNVMKTNVGGRNHPIVHKKTNMEILAAIDDTLFINFGLSHHHYYYSPETKLLEIPDLFRSNSSSRIEPQDRQDVEVTAKLFYLDTIEKEFVAQEAFMHLHKLLNVTHIDTLIVSDTTCWKSLEALVKSSQVKKLGVTDLDHDHLNLFLNHHDIDIPPVINHVHVDECCHNMPQDLIQLAKEKKIELLHHSDCTVILNQDELTHVLKRYGLVEQHTVFKPRWVLKYHVFVGSRNIIQDKGYVVMASRIK